MSLFNFKYYRSDEPASAGVIQMKEGELYFEVKSEALNFFPSHELPFNLQVLDKWNRVVWEFSNLYPGVFGTYWDAYDKSAIVKTATGKQIINWEFNDLVDGDICYQTFRSWALLNKGSRGVVVGANDGICGEWVTSVMNGDLFAILVEPTTESCIKLRDNWSKYNWVKIEEVCITDNGGPVTFYEGIHSVCNSIIKSHSVAYSGEVIPKEMQSITITDLTNKWDINGNWWLHLDCEGYDDKIIYSLKDDNLPAIICFEHVNYNQSDKDILNNWLISKGYKTYYCYMNGIAIKN